MRWMGRRGGSSYEGSNDKQRHGGYRSTHDEQEDSVPATLPPAPVQVTSAPASLACPSSSFAAHVLMGSSSSSAFTPCASGDVDAQAQAVKDCYLELVDQASQTQKGDGEPPVVDEKAIYYETVGGEKKRKVYGGVSHGSIFYPKSTQISSAGTSSTVLRNEIQELRQTIGRLEDNNNELRQSLREIKEERDQFKVEMINQMKDMMMHFKTEFLHQFTTQGSQPFNDGDHL